MNAFVLIMIGVVVTFDFFAKIGILPRALKYAPELISAIAVLYVVVAGAQNRFRFVRPAYWLTFAAIVAVIMCGTIANSVESGPVFAGMRAYLRAIPLFFLGAVYAFTERQVRSQLLFLVMLALIQLPIAIDQRLSALSWGNASGDNVGGTMLYSGILTIFLTSAACVLTAALLRKRISIAVFLPLFILILAPTMINETKVTIFLVPIGLLLTFLAASAPGTKLKNIVAAVGLLAMFGAIFVPTYDYLIVKKEYGSPLAEFFMEEKFDRYMSQETSLGATRAGRSDALFVPLREMARDPVNLAVGLGLGNASDSALGHQFTGKYFPQFEAFLMTAASVFILEIGLLGLGLVLILYWLIYNDCRAVADADKGILGMLANGWAGVMGIIGVATFYSDISASSVISYLFWYFSGLIAAQRVRQALERT